MADEKPLLPFTGEIQRSTTKLFPLETPVLLVSGVAGLTYRVGDAELAKLEQKSIEAVVSDNPDKEGCLVTFRNPLNKAQIVGVVLSDPDTRPEVDGVWVADDGSSGDDGGDC